MLERLIHEPLAREIGQLLLTLSSLNKIDLIWFDLIWFPLVLTLETSEISAIFVFTTKTNYQPHPQVFSVNGVLTCKKAALSTSSVRLADDGELSVCF